MDPADLLIRKARDYEILAASHEERAGIHHSVEHLVTATGFVIAAIVLREIAAALEAEER